MSTLKSPLVRLMISSYGNLGYQLRGFATDDFHSLLLTCSNMTLNLALASLSLYMTTFGDLFEMGKLTTEFHSHKPLFTFLVRVCIFQGQVGLHLTNLLYFAWQGRRLVAVLESFECLHHIFNAKQARRIFAIGLLLNSANFVLLYHNHLIDMATNSSKRFHWKLLELIVLYQLASLQYFSCNALLYGQFTIRYVLRRLTQASIDPKTVPLVLPDLARISDQLHRVLAVPLTVFMVLNLQNVIVVTCVAIFRLQSPHSNLTVLVHLLYPLTTWLYLAYLARSSQQNCDAFNRMCSHLRAQHRPLVYGLCDVSNVSQQWSNHAHIRHAELSKVYGHCLQMRLFRTVRLDQSLIVAACLFALNYVVFLSQTN